MLFLLYEAFKDSHAGRFLNFLRYPTFRIVAAGVAALLIGLFLGRSFIAQLRATQGEANNIREDTPDRHQTKKGTPTMGGALILLCVALATLLFADLRERVIWVALLWTLGFGFIGFLDDWLKLSKRNSKGLAPRKKLLLQTFFFVVGIFGILCTWQGGAPHLLVDTRLTLPFVPTRHFNLDLGWAYLAFAWVVVVGASNAVNLTDGLDGLAIVPTIVAALTFSIFCYVAGSQSARNSPLPAT